MFFCMETKETLIHHFWECQFVKTLWIRLKETLNNALQTNILLQPELFIFNLYEGEYSGVVNSSFLLIKSIYITANAMIIYQLLNMQYHM